MMPAVSGSLGYCSSEQPPNRVCLADELRPVAAFQPLDDPRWGDFLRRHPRSSVFHTTEWLTALRQTYGYEPIALTTCPAEADLTNAVVFCHVKSWLTGRRLVSLPFSDHCDLLVDSATDLDTIILGLRKTQALANAGYVELRPMRALNWLDNRSNSSYTYCLHSIDLRPSVDDLLRNCHKESTQRKIRRAERESLDYEEGRSTSHLEAFHRLMALTRRRHSVPPQPKSWFQNLIDSFGDRLKIRVALRNKMPIAAILTLRHKETLLYKYGCSDSRFHNLGGMHLLFWRSILEGKQDGLREFDLGRSEWNNSGLIMFKDRWGAKRLALTYVRLGSRARVDAFEKDGKDLKSRIARMVIKRLPVPVLSVAGNRIYRHIG